MAEERKIELWNPLIGIGTAMILGGIALLVAHDRYGLTVLIGGIILAGLGLALAFRQQREWRLPPKLPRGATCQHFPVYRRPDLYPAHPHIQELAIGLDRAFYPPDFRVICSAPLLAIEAGLMEIPLGTGRPPESRTVTRYHTSIDAVSITFPPLQPIKPPATIFITVFSDEPIRVKRIRPLKTKYEQTTPSPEPPPADPPSPKASG